MLRYVRRDLLRNPRRTLASLLGVVLGVGLFSGVLFFIDGSGASMTKRAIAPVAIDMQRVLTSPLGEGVRLNQRVVAPSTLRRGDRARISLTVRSLGASTANEVVVNDKLAAPLQYVPGSSRLDGRRLIDPGGQSPFAHGPGAIGFNIGSVRPGARVRMSYTVSATAPIADLRGQPPTATISSREQPVPAHANPPKLVGLASLREQIAALPGVAAANQLAFVQLPPGALRAGGTTIDRPLKVFGFETGYADAYPAVDVARGGFEAGAALLSPEAAQGLGVSPGDAVELSVPGGGRSVHPVSGIADLSRARALFNSREGLKLEDFLYLPDSIVISPAAFERIVIPAYRRLTAARGNALAVKSPPTLEVDVQVDRAPLNSDPGRALEQTQAVARRIAKIAPEQDFTLDNISNTLTVAKQDATAAKRMFFFLGLPGLLLAGFLAAYAGAILAASQRREQANLRLRGARPSQLTRMLAYRTAILAGAGSLLGTMLGFVSILVILGSSALFEASAPSLLTSGAIAIAAGIAVTGLALFVPGLRSLRREVSGERHEMALDAEPRWRRLRLDYAAVGLSALAMVVALRRGAFDAAPGLVSTGEATSLASYTLVLPLGAWLAGTLLAVRGVEGIARNLPHPPPPRFGAVVRGILSRTLGRRSRSLATGLAGVSLVVGFGTGLAIFAASYDGAKQADAEFTVGSDIRVTPSPISTKDHPAVYTSRLGVPGVEHATPVIAGAENAFMRSRFNSDVFDLAAVEPRGFSRTAALSDQFFPGSSAAAAMHALRSDPSAILVDSATADGLKLELGDSADVLLARGTRHQRLRRMTVAGLFDRFPGFPEGIQIVANLDYFQRQTQIADVDFFLLRTSDPRGAGLDAATAALRSGPGAADRLNVDTTATAYNKDQSSLTALNVRGLVDLDSFYTLAISAAVIGIFIFGLMLQRRREYVVLAAQGLPSRRLQLLIAGEAGFVAGSGLIGGVAIGAALGALLVHVLKPLFILDPDTRLPLGDVGLLAGLLALATTGCTLAAFWVLRRLSASEVLRES